MPPDARPKKLVGGRGGGEGLADTERDEQQGLFRRSSKVGPWTTSASISWSRRRQLRPVSSLQINQVRHEATPGVEGLGFRVWGLGFRQL